METLSTKRREYVERGLIKDKSKKEKLKKLAHVEIDHSSNLLIDNPPVPPPPAAVATSSRRKEKSISSLVESSAAESSKKNKISEALDRMNELWEPLNNLGTKGVTLDKSKSTEPVPKFTPILINLDENDEDEDEDDDDDDDEDEVYVPSPKIKEHRVRKQNVVQKLNVVPSSSNAKEKGEKGRRGRKKKETNNIPPSSSPPSPPVASGDGGSNNNNNNVAQVGVTDHHQEAATTISRGINTTSPLVVDDQHIVSSSTGIRRRGNPQNANAVRFQDSSKFNNVADQMNNNQIKLGSSTIPPLSQQTNLTLDKSKSTEPVPKFTPILINLDDDDEDEDEDDDEEDEEYVPSPKIKEHRVRKQNVVQKSNVVPSSSNAKEKGKKGRRGRKKKETNNIPPPPPPPPAASGDGGSNNNNNNVAQGGVTDHHQEATTTISRGSRVHPICFTLLADNQECPSSLPQISPPYIKIKDANKPASYIKKYLAKKLSLQSEDEVEVRMLGMPIRPDLPLQHLADLWLHVASSSNSTTDKIVKAGDSAEEFVIVVKYSRCQN
ncbi:Polycomb group RING finger protein 5 [Datura stramonium]|uniref:Polycomb group RING finger protein 5 n=1 Tax=Datura stramonium TaxID=4076 RepID=A0ABS8S2C8_DATST|nr:Polycomb group RING finger protein 5 [Datura stramonium]